MDLYPVDPDNPSSCPDSDNDTSGDDLPTSTLDSDLRHNFTTSHLQLVKGWFGLSISISIAGSGLLLLLLITSFRHRKLHTGAHILIIHVMLIQLLVCGIFYPIQNITTWRIMTTMEPVEIKCRYLAFFQSVASHTHNWASLILAVNRYAALAMPHQYKRLLQVKALIAMTLLPWVVGVAGNLPVYFGRGGHFKMGRLGCSFRTDETAYSTVWVTLGAYLPVCLMGVTYIALFLQLSLKRFRRRRITSISHENIHNSRRRRRSSGWRVPTRHARQVGICKMLVASLLWYCLCFLPGPIVATGLPHLFAQYFMLRLWLISVMLCGYAASPMIFLALSSDYRTATQLMLRRIWAGLFSRYLPSSSGSTKTHIHFITASLPRNSVY
ncbi:hypothetical protein BV898_03191 [Hypsibius exemplaris]|uniref:G-protein coupled receptors family 1 profile domain-containing protein n=1 Tax=Hypsibius exemplaris TaxID=2072580 RepID=A0A1W0X5V7_HYPEX|nr:hypothetical protein BV898_03191 [Hypsibius exemplaris]